MHLELELVAIGVGLQFVELEEGRKVELYTLSPQTSKETWLMTSTPLQSYEDQPLASVGGALLTLASSICIADLHAVPLQPRLFRLILVWLSLLGMLSLGQHCKDSAYRVCLMR